MFGIKKLKRRINDLDISRNEWVKIAKTGLEEIKSLKNDIESIKDGMNKWMKIANDRLEEIKTLKEKIEAMKISRDLSRKEIESQMSTIQDLRKKFGSNYAELSNCRKVVTERDNTIKTLESEVERLTRKRDANGRFVKSVPTKREFEVGDRVKIVKGFEPEDYRMTSPKYGFSFIKDMDKNIGETGKVVQMHESGALTVDFEDAPFSYDYQPDWLEHAD